MRYTPIVLLLFFVTIALAGEASTKSTGGTNSEEPVAVPDAPKKIEKIRKSDKEWRKQLSRKQFEVTRQGATETARTGRYWRHKQKGTYLCVCCDLELFPSKTKYESGTGWPSFYAPVAKEHIAQKIDWKLFYSRTEVLCMRCDAHLGHVFGDGPKPTGLRYCINSAALKFESEEERLERLKSQQEQQENKTLTDDTSPSAEAEKAGTSDEK